MADFADMASDLEQERLSHSLAERVSFQGESLYGCAECGTEIPAQRRAIGGVTRCVECQTCFESQQHHFRG